MSYEMPFPVVTFGEILWDILPAIKLPGGAPMNVAYHLKKLGTNPGLISKIGFDKDGEKLINILADNDISTNYVDIDYKPFNRFSLCQYN